MYQLPQRSLAIKGKPKALATESTKSASDLIEWRRLVIERFERLRERRAVVRLVEAEGKMMSLSVRGEEGIGMV